MSDPRLHDPEDELEEPAPVRRLRLMVSALLMVLIVGVVTVVATMVIRLGAVEGQGGTAPAPIAAEAIRLPAGEEITALGRAGGEILVTTRDAAGAERLRAFDATTGAARSETAIARD